MRLRYLIPVSLLLAGTLAAQERDFLTVVEVDQIREAQEPNLRLQTYLLFAQDRMKQLGQLLAEDRPGRSGVVHDLLEDYQRIIVAMDTVAEDALLRQVDISEGMAATVVGESELLDQLRAIKEADPDDLSRYEFVLDEAIYTTEDSIEVSEDDLGARASELLAQEKERRKARKALDAPAEALQDGEKAPAQALREKNFPDQPADSGRKPPTLRRPGDPPSRIDPVTPPKPVKPAK